MVVLAWHGRIGFALLPTKGPESSSLRPQPHPLLFTEHIAFIPSALCLTIALRRRDLHCIVQKRKLRLREVANNNSHWQVSSF